MGTEAAQETVTATVGGMKKDKRGTPFYNVIGEDGSLICRVGHYSDAVLEETDGAQRLLDYIPVFSAELEKGKWGGFVLDSVTSFADSAFLYNEHTMNSDAKDPRQWYAAESKTTADVVTKSLPGFPCHVGVSFHIHRHKVEQDGEKLHSVRQPYVPGKRMEETKRVASAWPELWRIFVKTDETRARVLQTDGDGKYQCGTCIGIPTNLTIPEKLPKDFLWKGGNKPDEMHVAVMADPHVGKSTFLAQLFKQLCQPLPFYVALFDARGKDAAYRRLGKVEARQLVNYAPCWIGVA